MGGCGGLWSLRLHAAASIAGARWHQTFLEASAWSADGPDLSAVL